MDIVYQVLTWAFGGTTLASLIGAVVYRAQNKRLKEAEVNEKEVMVEKAKIEARRNEIDLIVAQLERTERACEQKDKRMSELNDAIDKHINRRHELVDKLSESEQETNRVNRLLNEANQRIIKLTEERDKEHLMREHFEAWRCERTDCKDPRGPRPPRTELNGLRYEHPKQ